MNMEDLTGTQVLVNPQLTSDAAQKQGHRGMITYADPAADDFVVSFGKEQALYASDALLVMRQPREIFSDLQVDYKNFEKQELKDLYRIGMLLDSGRENDRRAAMDIVLANPKVQDFAMESLEKRLGPLIGAVAAQQTEMSNSRGRQ
jgi:hypothetical protein